MDNKELSKKIENFFAQFKLLRYKKSEVLFRAEDDPPGVYYLQEGFVKQYIISPDGSELILHIYGPGSFFPLMSVLGGFANTYFFAAMTTAVTFRAPKDSVLQFLKKEPAVVLELTKRLYHGMDGLLQRIEHLSLGTAYTRVISVFLYLAKHFGEKKGGSVIIPYKFTHHDISAIVGTVRETTTKEIDQLMREKLILYKDRSYVIPDIASLQKKLVFKR